MANFIWNDIKNAFTSRGNMITQLIVVNVAVFIIFNLLSIPSYFATGGAPEWLRWFYLPADVGQLIYQPWSLVTNIFFHGGLFHILFNMLWLWWVGRIMMEFLGARKVLSTFLAGGIMGGLLFVLAYNVLAPLTPLISTEKTVLLGASGGVTAVIFGAATIAPNYVIRLFLLGNIKLKWLAIGSLVLFTLLDFWSNTGGKIAHLGGAAWGYLYVRGHQNGKDYGRWLDVILDWFRNIGKPRQPKMKVKYKSKAPRDDAQYNAQKNQEQAKVDAILDKISKSGYDSLSKEEKDFLFRASNKK